MLYTHAVQNLKVPRQIIWGANDTALTLERYAYPIRNQMEIDRFFTVNGKHFLQEDHAVEIAEMVQY